MNRRIILALAVMLCGCARGLETTPEAVESEITAALGEGAGAAAIEKYLRQRKLDFTYDRFSNRYQSIIRDPNSDAHAISIYIHLDSKRRFVGVEARDSYTAP